MSEAGKGVAAMVLACLIWGAAPLFFKQLVHIDAVEILAHRMVWSSLLFAALLTVQGRLKLLIVALATGRSLGVVFGAALLISTNWLVFLLAIQWENATQAALGYYLFPLVAVVLGWGALGETLNRVQWLSVGSAALGVAVLTVGLGVAPWIGLVLSLSFGLYGLVKKRLSIGPVVSVTAEVAVLAPFALAWLIWLEAGGGGVFGRTAGDSALLVMSGVVTAVPLILFSYAARRVSLSTLGILQYINPTGQFICAVVIFREPFTGWHAAAFGLIWLALALYSGAAVVRENASRRAVRAASGPSTTVTRSRSEASANP